MAGLLTGELSLGLIGSLVLAFVLLAYETIADQQQWDFHNLKQRVRSGEKRPEIEAHPWFDDAQTGFLQSGLFRFSRHPNYFGELGFWWSIFLGYGSLNGGFSWMILGPIMLTLLFIGSTVFTEGITSSKYPEYREYQKTTSPIVPWIPGEAEAPKPDIA
jgi:steroid 5-alpha reductase family enzyme